MFSTQRSITRHAGVFALSAALVVGMGGCALVEQEGTNKPLTGLAACALGSTWNLDVAGLVPQVQADLAARGVGLTAISADGTQQLEWDINGHIVMTSDYTITMAMTPAADQTLTVTEKHSGKTTGIAYIHGEVAIPRDWDATGLAVTGTADNNGAPVDPVPFGAMRTDIDDSVGLELTCDGDTLTTHPRGTNITQTWTKS